MSTPNPTRVFLVDDHPIVLAGLESVINQEPDLEVCGSLTQGKGAAEAIAEADPSVVILDWALPDITGLEILKDLRFRNFDKPVIMVSLHDETHYAQRALRNGANGYIMKVEATDYLIEAIRKVLSGNIYLSSRMHMELARSLAGPRVTRTKSGPAGLTDREFQVYELMGQGLNTHTIADRLSIGEKTVATHRGRIKEKLGVNDMNALIRHAVAWWESQGGSNQVRSLSESA